MIWYLCLYRMQKTNSDIFIVCICCYLTSFCIIIMLQKSEEIPEIRHSINIFNHSGGSRGSTAGGCVTKSSWSAAGGECGRGIPPPPPPAGGVRGASPGKIFEKWTQMVHSEPIFCRVRVDFFQKTCVQFLPSKLRSSIYVMRENFHFSCGGSYKAKEGNFSFPPPPPSPRKFLKNGCNGCNWCNLSPFFANVSIFSPELCV